jgi:hypothetical protein
VAFLRTRSTCFLAAAVACALFPSCATPIVQEHCFAPAWEWANRDHLVVTFHAPATDAVVRFDAGIFASGALAELDGRERDDLLEEARASAALHENDRVLACFFSDLEGKLAGPSAPARGLIVVRNRDGEPAVILRGTRGWERCAVAQLDYGRASEWKRVAVIGGALPLFLIAVPVDLGIILLHGIGAEF